MPSTPEEVGIAMDIVWLDVTDDNPGFPTGFTLTVKAGTDYTFTGNQVTPDEDVNGTIQVVVTVTDPDMNTSADFLFDLEVTPINDPPEVTQAGPVNINEGSNITLMLSHVTIDDPDDVAFTLEVQPGANYSFTGNQVTPSADFFGPLTVNLVVNDGESDSNPLGFILDVDGINDLPTLNGISDVALIENGPAGDANLTGIGTGAANETQTLVVTIESNSNPTLFSAVTINYTSPNATGTISFTPAANQSGDADITVRVSDGVDFVEDTFTVSIGDVNNPPTLDAIGDVVINEDAATQDIDLLGISPGAGEEGSQTVVIDAISNNAGLIPTPTIVYGGSATGTLSFQPVANESGTATITVTVTDNGSTPQQITRDFDVTVSSVNDAPTLNAIANMAVDENAPNQAIPLSGITSGPAQESGQNLTVNASVAPASSFTIGVVYSSPDNTGTLNIQPDAGFSGVGTVTVVVQDNGGTANGGVSSVTRMFTFTVNEINDPPTISPIADVAVNEEAGPQTVGLTGISAGPGEGSQTLTITAISSNPTLIPNPTVDYTSGSMGSLDYQPAADRSGTANITVTVTDNGTPAEEVVDVFTVTVNEVNDPPTIDPVGDIQIDETPISLPQGVNLTGITDGSPNENQDLTVSIAYTNPGLFLLPPVLVYVPNNSTGTITYTPTLFASGSSTITVTVTDNGGTANGGVNTFSQQFTFTITDFNNPPSFDPITDIAVNEDAGSQNVNINNVSAGPGETQNVTLTATSSNPALIPDPSIAYNGTASTAVLTYQAGANLSGSSTITVRAVDAGSAEYEDTFVITVNAVNDPPTLNAISNVIMLEDAGALNVGLSGISPGPLESQTVTVTATSNNASLIPDPAVTYTSGPTGSISVQPNPNTTGVATITVTVTDSGPGGAPNNNTFSQQFTVSVNDINDPPTFDVIADVTVAEDATAQTVDITGISPGPGEVQTITITATSANTALIPNPNVTYDGSGATASLEFLPVANRSGSAVITVRAVDAEAGEFSRTFTINVTPVNDPPTIDAVSTVNITEDAAQSGIALTGITAGPFENQALTVTATPANAAFFEVFEVVYSSPGATGTLNVKPAANAVGSTTVTVTVTDGGSNTPPNDNTTSINFDINITPVNDPPVITGQDVVTINEDNTFTILVDHITITDPDNASGFIISAGSGANYTVAGTTVTPTQHYYGPLTVPITVSDGTNASPSFDFVITVNPVNDAPVIVGQDAINIEEAEPFVLSLDQIHVEDPDIEDVYPDGFSLTILAGADYSVTGTTITPIPNFSGVLQVPVFVNDGTLNSNTFTLQIQVNSVNDPPVIVSQVVELTINEEGTVALALTQLDVDDPDNTYPADFTMSVIAGANYTFNGLNVTPAANFNGPLNVMVSVNDGQISSSPFSMLVTVNPVNDPPVITGQNTVTTSEEVAVTLKLADLIVNDPDANDPYPAAFTMTASPGENYTVSGLTITPADEFNGTLTVPVVVNDGDVNSNTFGLQIQVSGDNDIPVITAQDPLPLVTEEDVPVAITLANLIVTDNDDPYPDGFSIIIQSGTNYTFSGTTITPTLDFTGTLTVNLVVNDGTSNSAPFAFELAVVGENDPPVITGQKQLSMAEDQTITIQLTDLTVIDPDPEDVYPGDFTMTLMPGDNYTLSEATVQPSANYFGTLTVPVRVSDGVNNSAPFNLQIQVNPVNDPPSFAPIANVIIAENTEDYAIQITNISAGPLEIQNLSILVSSSDENILPPPVFSPPYNGTNNTATILLNPVANKTGTATVTITVIDPGLLEAKQTFTVTVENINDPPTLNPITYGPIPEDSPEQSVPLTGITAGPGETQTLTVTATTDKPELFETFEWTYTSPQTTGTLNFLPKPDAFGSTVISVTVTDNGSNQAPHVNFITRTFTLQITAVDDPPVFQTEPVEVALIGEAYEYLIEVTDNDQGAVITIEGLQVPDWLTLTELSNGKASLTGTPPPGSAGPAMVSLSAKDDKDLTAMQNFTLIVDTRPEVSDFSLTGNEDESIAIERLKVEAAFSDDDNDLIQAVKIVKLPANGQLFVGSQGINEGQEISESDLGNLSYKPLQDFTGKDTVVWNGTDGYAYATLDARIFITVNPINDPPVIVALETAILTVNAGEGPVPISTEFEAQDVDNEFLTSAEIRFRGQNFVAEDDLLIFEPTAKITGEYIPASGILALTGTATVAEYNEAIRSVKYDNVSAVFSAEEVVKTISYTVDDGQALSVPRDREIKLIDTFEELVIPNGFTPNNDGDNDIWFITNIDRHIDASVRVYTMMGQIVYTSDGFYDGWDGLYNGKLLPTDTYYYTIDLNLPFRKKVYKGAVTILR